MHFSLLIFEDIRGRSFTHLTLSLEMLALLLLIKSMYLFSYGMDITITYVGLDSPMISTFKIVQQLRTLSPCLIQLTDGMFSLILV